ncbi:flavin reductase (DIM6/NTAB) family NADH-FMN oxidoreductase RutF [Dysgonomonas alginatilytica]|uniref:Flavin reductase (DIM6/NTAB) family NADH-FMN oxidoreductase RutF n=1 Tax=Dysgonomonas alginatilytica TaxID=1605892 RepID=A0A2V3PKI8_9BACT|nr:DUF4468 domain-containing protein [Dysgonomonas alginatilytica]PXV58880.1 flavin reductase (DIM6/NTAB) family NADH-FMN oxidoreductase RutF [Dysgonomonas alginatilytica]
MKKHILFILFAIISLSTYAQVDSKYLKGAVPEVDGKIVFSSTIKVNNSVSDEKIFDLMNKWAQENYASPTNPKQRILLANPADKTIACRGEKDIIFSKSALSLDKTTITYQLILKIESGECLATVKNIKYDYYDKGNKDYYTAEEMISDKVALNGEKLNRYYDKFRTHTIDSINGIFNSIDIYLNGVKRREGAVDAEVQRTIPMTNLTEATPSIPMVPLVASSPAGESAQTTNTTSGATLAGFRQISADKIPGNIVKLLNNATLITSGSGDDINVMTASWGGLGVFWEKPVAFCFLGAQRYSISTMDKGDTYTISFYTEAYNDAIQYCGSVSGRNEDKIKGSGLTPIKTPSGATAFTEAWMILECKKMIAQPLSQDAIADTTSDAAKKWNGKALHKMYIGEILNVWIK